MARILNFVEGDNNNLSACCGSGYFNLGGGCRYHYGTLTDCFMVVAIMAPAKSITDARRVFVVIFEED